MSLSTAIFLAVFGVFAVVLAIIASWTGMHGGDGDNLADLESLTVPGAFPEDPEQADRDVLDVLEWVWSKVKHAFGRREPSVFVRDGGFESSAAFWEDYNARRLEKMNFRSEEKPEKLLDQWQYEDRMAARKERQKRPDPPTPFELWKAKIAREQAQIAREQARIAEEAEWAEYLSSKFGTVWQETPEQYERRLNDFSAVFGLH